MRDLSIRDLGLDFPEPEDKAFVSAVRTALEVARARAVETMRQANGKAGIERRRETVAQLTVQGYREKEIANMLGVQWTVVRGDLKVLKQRYQARSLHHLTALLMLQFKERMRDNVVLPDDLVADVLLVMEAFQSSFGVRWSTWGPFASVQERLRDLLPMEKFIEAVNRYTRWKNGSPP